MEIDKKKETICLNAFKAWKNADGKGTVEMATGSGKTFVALHALSSMKKGSTIIFLYEVIDRQIDIIKQIQLYNVIYNINIFNDYKIIYKTYQSAYKLKYNVYDLVIADEIHDSLTPSYFQFYENNCFTNIIGLSATVDRDTLYGNGITKGYYLDSIAPVCYNYTLKEAQNDGVARKLKVYIIEHHLDKVMKIMKAGNVSKPFYTTEFKNYEFWNNKFNGAFLEDDGIKDHVIKQSSKKRSDILYKLPSKIKEVKKLIKGLDDKTLLFANSIDSLLEITENVVSSRNTNTINNKIKLDFEENKIDLIGSFKKLTQGINLNQLDNVILMSYYSKTKDFIQRSGRLRKNGEKIGNLFVFVTKNTQEEVWFNKMFNKEDVNFITCTNVEDCLEKLKNE